VLWTVNTLLFAYAQYLKIGSVTSPMILTVLLHFAYVLHYFVVETNVLAMVDFTGDHMGWMLGWGNGVLVPFFYSIPEFYLYNHTHEAPAAYLLLVLAMYAAGYYVFAQANLQKKAFRADNNTLIWGERPKVLKTASGRNLLLSGWWGVARHINYTGDLVQAYSFGLATYPWSFFSLLPFINGIFLTAVTVQREGRDHRWCKAKYGADWDEYCRLVPHKMIPYVY